MPRKDTGCLTAKQHANGDITRMGDISKRERWVLRGDSSTTELVPLYRGTKIKTIC